MGAHRGCKCTRNCNHIYICGEYQPANSSCIGSMRECWLDLNWSLEEQRHTYAIAWPSAEIQAYVYGPCVRVCLSGACSGLKQAHTGAQGNQLHLTTHTPGDGTQGLSHKRGNLCSQEQKNQHTEATTEPPTTHSAANIPQTDSPSVAALQTPSPSCSHNDGLGASIAAACMA